MSLLVKCSPHAGSGFESSAISSLTSVTEGGKMNKLHRKNFILNPEAGRLDVTGER